MTSDFAPEVAKCPKVAPNPKIAQNTVSLLSCPISNAACFLSLGEIFDQDSAVQPIGELKHILIILFVCFLKYQNSMSLDICRCNLQLLHIKYIILTSIMAYSAGVGPSKPNISYDVSAAVSCAAAVKYQLTDTTF